MENQHPRPDVFAQIRRVDNLRPETGQPLGISRGRSDAGPHSQEAFRHTLTRVAATEDQDVQFDRLSKPKQIVRNDPLTAAAITPQFRAGHEEDAPADQPLQRLVLAVNSAK